LPSVEAVARAPGAGESRFDKRWSIENLLSRACALLQLDIFLVCFFCREEAPLPHLQLERV